MKPSSSMHCYMWILLERSLTRLFCATNPESRPETFQVGNRPFLKFAKKIFPATQNCPSRGILLPEGESLPTEKGESHESSVASEWFLEGWPGAVVLIEYFAFVDAHDPVESED